MIDYSLAGDLAYEVRAFAIVESNENESAVGDDGQAYGLLQMHPATFKRFYGAHKLFPADNYDTWTQAQIKACAAYLTLLEWQPASQEQRDLIVQSWNLGEAGVFIHNRRNLGYLARWLHAYDRVKLPQL